SSPASSLTRTTSLGSVRSRTTKAVVILVVLAMGRRVSGCRANRTWPVSRSSRIAAAAWISGVVVDGSGVARAVGNGDGEPNGGTGVGGGVVDRDAPATDSAD